MLIAMAAAARITINPKVLGGKPTIRGTRFSVELLLRDPSEGSTVDDLLSAYPTITEADVRAAIAYAADTIADEETVPVAMTPPKKARR
jgi:uncharacterized protein (DUF433 family)